MTEVGADIHQTMEGSVNDLFTHHVSVMTEVGADIHQTMEGSGTLVIEEGDGTTITVTQATDDDNEVRGATCVSFFFLHVSCKFRQPVTVPVG